MSDRRPQTTISVISTFSLFQLEKKNAIKLNNVDHVEVTTFKIGPLRLIWTRYNQFEQFQTILDKFIGKDY